MTVTVTQELDEVALRNLLQGPDGAVARDMLRRGLRVQTLAKRKCKADTGRLRGSITLRAGYAVVLGRQVPVADVGTNVSYALAVHNGTGVYGPSGQLIRPRNGRYLVFTIKGQARRNAQGQFIKGTRQGSRLVFAREVKGQPANPFLKDALPAAIG